MSKIIDFQRNRAPKHSFDELVRPHFAAVFQAARRLTLCDHDADDLLQEVLIKAFARLEDLARCEHPRAWLLKVTYTTFVDHIRSNDRSPVSIAETGDLSDDPDDIEADGDHLADLVDRQLEVERVLRAMRYLNAEQCALVAMHDVEGLTIEELHKLTGMPVGTIKAQLYRTRRKIGRLLENAELKRPKLRVVGGKP